MNKAVYCTADNETKANEIVRTLLDSGFNESKVSVLYTDAQTGRPTVTEGDQVVPEKSTKSPEAATTGTVAGGVIGGTIGLLAGIGSLAIPGLGALVAAGPIMGALSGMAVGGSVGLVTGALIGLGIPEYEAKHIEDKLKKGQVLVCAHTFNQEETDRVKDIYRQCKANDINVVDEVIDTATRKSTFDTSPTQERSDYYDENRDRLV